VCAAGAARPAARRSAAAACGGVLTLRARLLRGLPWGCAAPAAAQSKMDATHHVVDGPEDLLDLAHLRLVLQEDGRVEVGDLRGGGAGARRWGSGTAAAMGRSPGRCAAASMPGGAAPEQAAMGEAGQALRGSRGPAGGPRRAADLLIGELQHGLALAGVRKRARLHDGVRGALIVAAPAAEPAAAEPAPSAAASEPATASPERWPHLCAAVPAVASGGRASLSTTARLRRAAF
jgi:hypothetical protein